MVSVIHNVCGICVTGHVSPSVVLEVTSCCDLGVVVTGALSRDGRNQRDGSDGNYVKRFGRDFKFEP